MSIVREFPHQVREIEHMDIVMPDGCRLGARIWMPEGAESRPVPAILEYIPYRKSDMTLGRDRLGPPYIAGHGYAYVRLDLRGTGDSEGLMLDEYLQQELDDGRDAIAWIAKQDWCDGNVGMMGISWGGFNSLQVAALRPPALKAIITCCSTDDRYADDVHYMGGTMLIDQISWAAIMFGRNTLPPDPRNVGERWRSEWLKRLEGSGLWLKTWLEHQTRDDFWKHGSICENYADIEIPVYAIGGWADGYCRAVFRLMENLAGPRKGLIGPWAHTYPHLRGPGPAINFLREQLRWWDQWLKGRNTGIMDEPQLRLFMQDHAEPRSLYREREGRWIAEPSWPSANVSRRLVALGSDGRLAMDGSALPGAKLTVSSPLWVGLGGGKWCSYAGPGDQPVDQRGDDAGSLVFQTEPLAQPLEIAGDAALDLTFESDRPMAMVAVRLVDVAPDGQGTRVSYGLLNLTHRESHEHPQALEPGKRYTVRVPFKHVAQRFRTAHRLRLSISTSYFPLAWPSPEPVVLTIFPDETKLELPVRAPQPSDAGLASLGEAERAPALETEIIAPPQAGWRVISDLGTGAIGIEIAEDNGAYRIIENGLTIRSRGDEHYGFSGNDYRSVFGEARWDFRLSRDGWNIRTLTETRVTSGADAFRIEARLQAWEGEDLVHEQSWSELIPRHLV